MEKKEINHVLIVEDDKEIREGVEIYLRSQGYEVFQAADGIEGLAVVEKEEIHLAIVDVMMPRMDGIQMTIKLREKHDFPVIFLSAKSEEVDKILGLNMGADDYVTKPFTPMELLARVNSQMRRYRKFLEKLGGREKGENVYDRRLRDQRRFRGSICGRGTGEAYSYRVQDTAAVDEESGKSVFCGRDL